jgi:hypothetical protein
MESPKEITVTGRLELAIAARKFSNAWRLVVEKSAAGADWMERLIKAQSTSSTGRQG